MTTDTKPRVAFPVPKRPDPLDRSGWLIPAVPAFTGLSVNVWGIHGTSLWRDEAVTIGMATRPIGSMFHTLATVDAVHTPYYLLMRPVVAVFGTGELAVRMPSVLAMAATAALTALLGRRLVSPRAGLISGLLVATVFPYISRYAQEARSYALVTALAVLATYLFVRALDSGAAPGPQTWWPFVRYGLALELAVLIHLFAMPLLLAHGAAVVSPGGDRALLRRWAVTAGAVVLIAAPLAVFAAAQGDQVGWIGDPRPRDIRDLITSLGGSPQIALVMLGLVVLGLTTRPTALAAGTTRMDLRRLAAGWILIPPVVLLSVSLVHPVYLFRYVLYCIPAVALLAGAGLARLRPWAALPVGLVLLLLVFPAQQDMRASTAKADNLRKLSKILLAYEQPGDALVFHNIVYRRIISAYPKAFTPLMDIAQDQTPSQAANLQGTEVGTDTLRQRADGVTRVWYIDNRISPGSHHGPLDAEKKRLFVESGLFHRVQSWRFRGGTLYLLERT